jgi:transglutaminase-like putative cysteine protease
VRVLPWPAVSREHTDIFGNRVNYFCIQQSHGALEVSAVSEVEVIAPPQPDEAASPPWEQVRERLHDGQDAASLPRACSRCPPPAIPPQAAALDYALASFTPGRPVLEAARELMARIYTSSNTTPPPPASPPRWTGAHGAPRRLPGLRPRRHRLPARPRARGALRQRLPGDLPPPGQPKLRGADASHAWYASTCRPAWARRRTQRAPTNPGGSWIDYDPTNDCLLGEQHITTAVGRDYRDVMPVRGVFYGGGEHQLSVAVDVDRLTA